MARMMDGSWLERRSTWFVVSAAAIVVFTATNLPWQLEDYDQAKQAFTSLEMIQQGHWLYQHTPNGWVATKPPLVGWISALIFAVSRSWELAWRLPSMVAAGALVCFVARSATRAYGAAAGLLALAAVSLNLFAPRLATLARTDMPLALIIFLIGAQILEKIRTEKSWTTRDRVTAFAWLSAAMLVKGPIVYAFLLPGIAGYQWWARRRGDSTSSAWCGAWPWLLSLLVFALWVAGGIHTVPEFLEHVVIREFAGRFEGTHKAQPFYFYLPHLIHRFAPWSILLIVFAWWQRRMRTRLSVSAETAWLLCWSLGGLLVMSVVPSKRVDRIFPVIPPLALLLAAQFAQLKKQTQVRSRVEWWSTFATLAACVFTVGYSASKILPALRQHRDAFAVFGREVREDVAARQLRLDVVGGEDEGMLLYLRRPQFVDVPNAVAHWRAGTIDAIVAPEENLAKLTSELADPDPSKSRLSGPAGNHHRRYAFLSKRIVQTP